MITAQPAHKLQALQAGAKDFVSKPFDVLEVKTRIHNMLEVRLLYKRLEQTVEKRTAELRESEAALQRRAGDDGIPRAGPAPAHARQGRIAAAMEAFQYQALNAAGRTVSGVVQADTPRQARTQLRALGLLPSALDQVRRARARAGRGRAAFPRRN